MKKNILTIGMVIVLLAATVFSEMQWRWVLLNTNLSNKEKFDESIALIDELRKASYNGLVLADPKLDFVNVQSSIYLRRLKLLNHYAKLNHIEIIPIVASLNPKPGILSYDVNLAEAIKVVNQPLRAENGRLVLANKDNILNVLSFSNLKPHYNTRESFINSTGWEWADENVWGEHLVVDENEIPYTGTKSLKFKIDNTVSHNRLSKTINMRPYTQYRISLYIKRSKKSLSNDMFRVSVLSSFPERKNLSWGKFKVPSDGRWAKYEVVFNSQEFTKGKIWLGNWGVGCGEFWISDVVINESLGVNLVRREGCPVTLRDSGGELYYKEGDDYTKWIFKDLGLAKGYRGSYHQSHKDIPIELTNNSDIKEGEYCEVSYYYAPVVNYDEVALCLSTEHTYSNIRENIKRINELIEPQKVLLNIDEVRIMNQCALCQSKKMSSGQLLAEATKKIHRIIFEEMPNVKIFMWGDMYSPFMNAVEDYYLCEGSLEGALEGVSTDINIVKWGRKNLVDDLLFFNQRGYRLLYAGYYDAPDLISEMELLSESVHKLKGPKLEGIMYCSWKTPQDFSKLKEYIEASDMVNGN